MQLILVGGKGGVGKTTVSSATAIAAADRGQRVLLTSTDPAHSLADVVGVPLGDVPRPITDGLHAQQLDSRARLRARWGRIDDYLTQLLTAMGADGLEAEELAMVPGLEELFELADLQDHLSSGRWDTIVVDCSPTAETLRLLRLPAAIESFRTHGMPSPRRWVGLTRRLAESFAGVPVPGGDVLSAAEDFLGLIGGMSAVLSDPDRCWVRLVTLPERAVVAETKRTFSYLTLFGHHVDAVVVNRVPTRRDRSARHERALHELTSSFGDTPTLLGPDWGDELIGFDALRAFGRSLYGETSPNDRRHGHQPFSYRVQDRDVVIDVPLPGLGADDIRLRREDPRELEIRYVATGATALRITVADSLVGRTASAVFRDGQLEITLREETTS